MKAESMDSNNGENWKKAQMHIANIAIKYFTFCLIF